MANPEVTIDLLLNSKKLNSKLSSIGGRIAGALNPRSLKSFGGFATKVAGSVAKIALKLTAVGAAAAAGLGAAALLMSKMADTAEKAQWKFDIVFKNTSASANKAAKDVAGYFHQHVSTIQRSMATVADVLKPAGATEEQAARLSRSLTILGQGAEEWTQGRYDAKTATEAFMKALVGEREMLKEMGIVIREADVKGYVKEQGWAQTELNKMLATYNLILERSVDLQASIGTRIKEFGPRLQQFGEAWKGLMVNIGQLIKPMTTELLHLFNAIQDKMADIVDSNHFDGVRRVVDMIASKIFEIAKKVEGMDVSKISADLRLLLTATESLLFAMTDIAINYLEKALIKAAQVFGAELYKVMTESGSNGLEDLKQNLQDKIPFGKWSEKLGLTTAYVPHSQRGGARDGKEYDFGGDRSSIVGNNMAVALNKFLEDTAGLSKGGNRNRPGRQQISGPETEAEKAGIDWKARLKQAGKDLTLFNSKLKTTNTALGRSAEKLVSIQEKITELQQKQNPQVGTSGIKEMYNRMLTTLNEDDPTVKQLRDLRTEAKELAEKSSKQRQDQITLLRNIEIATKRQKTATAFGK